MRDKTILPYKSGLVLKGYDIVEYHFLKPDDRGVKGIDEHQVQIRNKNSIYTFHFKSNHNKTLFRNNPKKYLPGIGGFCLYGLAYEWNNIDQIKYLKEDSRNWKIPARISSGWKWSKYIMGPPAEVNYGWLKYNNKIYFNYSKHHVNLCQRDIKKTVELAEKRWKSYYSSDIGPINIDSYGLGDDNWPKNNELYNDQMIDIFKNDLHYMIEAFEITGNKNRLENEIKNKI